MDEHALQYNPNEHRPITDETRARIQQDIGQYACTKFLLDEVRLEGPRGTLEKVLHPIRTRHHRHEMEILQEPISQLELFPIIARLAITGRVSETYYDSMLQIIGFDFAIRHTQRRLNDRFSRVDLKQSVQ
jgi:hypothetical protein